MARPWPAEGARHADLTGDRRRYVAALRRRGVRLLQRYVDARFGAGFLVVTSRKGWPA